MTFYLQKKASEAAIESSLPADHNTNVDIESVTSANQNTISTINSTLSIHENCSGRKIVKLITFKILFIISLFLIS